jgi:hypothetical protein
MSYVNFLKRGERIEYLLEYEDNLVRLEAVPGVLPLCEELFEVDLCALHDDEGIFFLIILISLHFGDQVSLILDEPFALLRQLLHKGDFL